MNDDTKREWGCYLCGHREEREFETPCSRCTKMRGVLPEGFAEWLRDVFQFALKDHVEDWHQDL